MCRFTLLHLLYGKSARKAMVRKYIKHLNNCYLCELGLLFLTEKHTSTSCSTSSEIMKLLLSPLGGQLETLACD